MKICTVGQKQGSEINLFTAHPSDRRLRYFLAFGLGSLSKRRCKNKKKNNNPVEAPKRNTAQFDRKTAGKRGNAKRPQPLSVGAPPPRRATTKIAGTFGGRGSRRQLSRSGGGGGDGRRLLVSQKHGRRERATAQKFRRDVSRPAPVEPRERYGNPENVTPFYRPPSGRNGWGGGVTLPVPWRP